VKWNNGETTYVLNKRSCLALISAGFTGSGAKDTPVLLEVAEAKDNESCLRCKGLISLPDNPIFFCATCSKGKPGFHHSCAQDTGLAVPSNSDLHRDDFVWHCNKCKQQPLSGGVPLIIKADPEPPPITRGRTNSTCSIVDVLHEVRRAIRAMGCVAKEDQQVVLPDVSQQHFLLLLRVCERKLHYLVETNAIEKTTMQTV
jgi:hypothetical protein